MTFSSRWHPPDAPLDDRELGRRIALILSRADAGDPEFRDVGRRIALILAGAQTQKPDRRR